MNKVYRLPFLFLSLILSLLIACSPNDHQHTNTCEQHPEIRTIIDNYLSLLKSGDFQGEKSVSSNGKIEMLQLNGEEMADAYSILIDLDIDLPNLIGRYACEISSDGEERSENYFALDSQLTTRSLDLTYRGDDLIFLEGKRKVGSVLARIRQHLKWDVQTGQLSVQVDYRNLFGREYYYEIDFIPGDSD